MRQPRISRQSSWKRHERRVLEVLVEALLLLRSEERLSRLREMIASSDDKRPIEDKINRELYLCLNQVNRELLKVKRGLKTGVNYEMRNQPTPKDIYPTEREQKRPDFSWGYFEPISRHFDSGNRYFVIECKRLGEPTSKSWKFNKKYVQNGILRFVKIEYGYGEDESSGAIVGYVESMDFDDILLEINTEIKSCKEAIPELSQPKVGWQTNKINSLDHTFDRPFPISPFHLWHFWLDFRGCYDRNVTKKSSTK